MLTKGARYSAPENGFTKTFGIVDIAHKRKTCDKKNIPDEKDGGHVVGSNILLPLNSRSL